jgi:GDP-L-fucose synthase
MDKNSVILITGAGGVLGNAILHLLHGCGYNKILTPTKMELDCTDAVSVHNYIEKNKPRFVFHLASLVFGIKGNLQNQANSFRANTLMSLHVLEASAKANVEKLFYAGTVASYPFPYLSMPIQERDFWIGKPHNGEYGYALAKRNALGLLEILKESSGMDFVYGIFTNLFGPNDKFNIETGHVIPSLVAKTVAAEMSNKRVLEVWGNAGTTRDFLYSADAAKAALLCMEKYSGEINIASGIETSMGEIAAALKNASVCDVDIRWRDDQPVGIPRRYFDVSRLKAIGFEQSYPINVGVAETLNWYRDNRINARV